MAYDIENLPQRINIGASGTNRQRIFQFDVSKWIEKWPEATFNICVQRPTESEDEPYFGDISLEDGILYWIVHYADTENVGNGWMEIHAFIPGEDELFAKSKRVVTVIEQSLCNTAGETPEPSEPWVSRVEQAAANALEAAGDAEGYAGTAQSSATSAAGSASSASSSASSAAGSAQSAATSAGNAGTSAQAAAGSASAAAGSATAAAGSAASALDAADSASASSAAANTAKNRAAASATDAEASAQDAQTQVIAAEAAADRAEAAAGGFVIDRSLTKSGKSADAKVTGNRITNLEYALNGYAFREEEDDDDAYTKVVPASAMPYAELDAVGGKTVVWNRSPQTVRSNDQSITGITYTRIDDNTCRVHGTNTGTGGAWPVIFAHTVPPSGHKCYFFGLHALTEFAFTDGGFYWQPFGYFPLTASDCILTSNGTNVANAFLVVPVGKTLDVTIHPQFVDLTQMFGAGHEPTLEQCRQIFAAESYPYSAPTIKHAGVTEVKTIGKNMLNASLVTKDGWNLVIPNPFTEPGQYTVSCVKGSTDYDGNGMAMGFDGVRVSESTYADFKTDGYSRTITVTAENVKATTFVFMPQTSDRLTSDLEERGFQIERGSSKTAFVPYHSTAYAIPAAVQALEGYGWSAIDVCNSIEWDGAKWWYVKRVGRIEMSDYNMASEIYNGNYRYRFALSSAMPRTPNLISNKYYYSNNVIGDNDKDLSMFFYNNGMFYFRDDSITQHEYGKHPELAGVYVYFELATETRTDITSLMNMDGYINVEAGGTVTFEHAMGTTDSIRVPVPNKETFLIKLPGGGA